MIALHDELYTGILEPYLREDIEYIPHIGLGHFIKESEKYMYTNPTAVDLDEVRYKRALEEVRNLDLSCSAKVEKLQLIEINDEFTFTRDIEEFF